MTDPPSTASPDAPAWQTTAEPLPPGEQYAVDHDPGPPEDYAGDPVPDPWEEDLDGQLDSGAVPGLTA